MRQPSRDGRIAEDGYGQQFTVQDLQLRRISDLKARLQELRPELLQEGIVTLQAKRTSDLAIAKLEREIHTLLGGDAVVDMMKMFSELAAVQQAVKPTTKRK